MRTGLCGLALACLASGCLDLLGYEETVTQSNGLEGSSMLQDDRIEDKHPTFDPFRSVTEAFLETESFAGSKATCQVTLNKSATVTKLEIQRFDGADAALDGKLFRGRTEALAALASVADADPIPSMEVVNGALKPFNDGLYAAVELQVEAQKVSLLTMLLARVGDRLSAADAITRAPFQDAAVLLGAALILGGGATPATLDASLQSRARARADAFAATPAFARPIGFYTWTPALGSIFTRDRFLQNGDDTESFGAFAALAFVLGQDAALLADYQRVSALYAGLTNPYSSYPVDALIPYVADTTALANLGTIESAFTSANPPRKSCGGTLVAFLPASRSKDVDYFDAQFCTTGVPAGVDLLDVLVGAIRDGTVDLATGPDSGWYDYQLNALETLLLPERGPESQHLLLTAGYKKKLVDTFKSILIQNRETYVKQLSVGGGASSAVAAAPVDIYPLLPAEPFPTFYLRTARGYRFLRAFLEATLGADFLAGNGRLDETGGRATAKLAGELDQRVALLYGLFFVGADAVGMARDEGILPDEMAEIDATAAVTAARAWLLTWRTDPDVVRDPRVIVPLFVEDDGSTHYAAVVGVKALKSRAEFVAGHGPVVTPTSCWTGRLVARSYTLLVEETADVLLPANRPPPTRDELRAICDAHATKDAIVQALESP